MSGNLEISIEADPLHDGVGSENAVPRDSLQLDFGSGAHPLYISRKDNVHKSHIPHPVAEGKGILASPPLAQEFTRRWVAR